MSDFPKQSQIVVCPLAGQNISIQPGLSGITDGESEIDLLGIAKKALKYKKVFVFFILVFAALGVAYSSTRPTMYKAVITLDPTKHLNVKNTESGSIAQKLGGLMGLGGGGFESGSNEPRYNKAIMGTHRFHLWMIKKYNLRDSVQYLAPKVDAKLLTDDDVAGIFGGAFELELGDSGFASLKTKTYSPTYSAKLAVIVVDAINAYAAQTAIDRAKSEIAIFNTKLETVTYLETRQMLFSLVSERTKTIMLAEAQPEYAFQIMDLPESPSPPLSKKRLFTVGFSIMIGCLVGGVIAVFLELRPFQFLRRNQ